MVVLVVLISVVLANVLANVFPKLPAPLIQIAIGTVLGLVSILGSHLHSHTISSFYLNLDQELFMALVIAPLLFREAEEADIISLWSIKKTVIPMAFLLVFITVGAIGFSVHAVFPTLVLPACFALGAILGPTDVVAASAFSRFTSIDKKLKNIIKGEGLINDASGVIAFTYASAALASGKFFAPMASLVFILGTLGGVVVGLLIVAIKDYFTDSFKSVTTKNAATYMLIELIIPFASFFAAEQIGCSGVIAAVVAGSRQALMLKKLNIFEAELFNMKNGVWELINFFLNSMVFILLGMQLPGIIIDVINIPSFTLEIAILLPILATAIIFLVRMLSVFIMAHSLLGQGKKARLKNAVLLTLFGVKGTVSLATAFALPYALVGDVLFVDRPILLYTTTVCIFLTMLPAIIFLPKLGDKVEIATDEEKITILEAVLSELRKQYKTIYTNAVILFYRQRVSLLRLEEKVGIKKKEYKKARRLVKSIEKKIIDEALEKNEISKRGYAIYQRLFKNICSMTVHPYFYRLEVRLSIVKKAMLRCLGKNKVYLSQSKTLSRSDLVEIKMHFWANTDKLIDYFSGFEYYDAKFIQRIIDQRIENADYILDILMKTGESVRFTEEYENAMLRAFEVERGIIQGLLSSNKIKEATAADMRIELNKLEMFILQEYKNNILMRLIRKKS
jgi:CPA1 family monovalent cation:H+ antiporter